jgi:hypothetical protein
VVVAGAYTRGILHPPQFEILGAVVVALAVAVVHALMRFQPVVQHPLHHEDVLEDVGD